MRQAVRLLRKHEEDRREIDLLRAVKGPSIPDLDGLAEAITDAYDREGVD